MDAPLPLPAVLRQARIERGLSLGQLSRLCGVHKASLSRWEAGHTAPRVPELRAVMDALHVPNKTRKIWWAGIDAPRALRVFQQNSEPERFLHPGDHLRALRGRAGKPQSAVARQIGVPISVVGKWERGEVRASGAELHTFCFVCEATAEEAAYLTVAAFPSTEVIAPTRETVRDALMTVAFREFPQERDVPFLTLAAQMELLIRQNKATMTDMVAVWGRHTEALASRNRWAEAAPIARRVRSVLMREGGVLDFHGTPSVITAASLLRWESGAGDAARFLEQFLPHIALQKSIPGSRTGTDQAGRAWALSAMGALRELAGSADEGVKGCEDALALVLDDAAETYYRRADLIAALLRSERLDEAAKHIRVQPSALLPHLIARDKQYEAAAHSGSRQAAVSAGRIGASGLPTLWSADDQAVGKASG